VRREDVDEIVGGVREAQTGDHNCIVVAVLVGRLELWPVEGVDGSLWSGDEPVDMDSSCHVVGQMPVDHQKVELVPGDARVGSQIGNIVQRTNVPVGFGHVKTVASHPVLSPK